MLIDNCALIDSHCHPHFSPLGDDLTTLLEQMRTLKVSAALAVATTSAEMAVVKKLAVDYPGVFYAACGIHPTTDEAISVETLVQQCQDESVLAVGETGLDFFHQSLPTDVQQQQFVRHINAAKIVGKPLIIHTRDSQADALALLLAEKASDVGGVFHCYTGDVETMRQILDINFMISFSGIVSFKSAESLRTVARYVPSDRYLVETDSPYLAPTPHRGKTNTPGFVRYVAQAVAAVRDCDEQQIANETTANFKRLFRPKDVA